MGGSSRFSYNDYVTTTKSKLSSASSSDIFKSNSILDDVNPAKMKNGIRESCDSDAAVQSTPIIIGLDCTGSMGKIPFYMIKEGLGELFKEIYARVPVTDPQVLFCTIGDIDAGDPNPFSVGQFEQECGLLVDGLQKFWIDGCYGGGNNYESYDLPYYFATNMTSIDSFKKRGQKGYIFTIGDEPPPKVLRKEAIQEVFGIKAESDMSFEQIINQVQKTYIPFHIIMEEGSHVRNYGLDCVRGPWRDLLGENAIICSDYTKLSEVIVSILQVKTGTNKTDVINSWDGTTSLTVGKAIAGLSVIDADESLIF